MTPEEQEQIAILSQHPAFKLLVRAVEEERDRRMAKLAREFTFKADALNQRALDEERGFFKGALWVALTLPESTYSRWMETADKAMEEGDEEWLKRFATL
jgi:hypothetical protein